MILIFGGAYQGKLAYALDRFKAAESDVYQCKSDDVNTPENRKIIYEIDKWILALVKNNIDVEEAVRQFIDRNQHTPPQSSGVCCSHKVLDSGFIPNNRPRGCTRKQGAAGSGYETLATNQNVVVICNDISCGVVPLDPVLRKWREAVGRSLTMLSRISDEVIRLFCGIPARVK